MRLHSILTPAAALIALAVASAPALADQRERGERAARGGDRNRSDRTESQDRAGERARPRTETPSRTETPPRPEVRPQVVVPRAVPRPEVVAPRVERPRGYTPHYEPRYEPRHTPRYEPRHRNYGYGYPVYRPYLFRPRLHLGFGVWLGYPVPYAYAYPVPVYGYAAPRESIVVGPGSSVYGGVSFEISPDDAFVYVDGNYAGIVRDFDGTDQPLTLAGGSHRIELQAPGYEPMTIDVTVQPGQVIPYRGDMRRW